MPSPLMLAETYDRDYHDPRGWWLSEKLDGVRCYWDGTRLTTRGGNALHSPAWFTAGLPTTPLDGELWAGRDLFQSTVGIVRRKAGGEAWRGIRFHVFDLPAMVAPWEARMRAIPAAVKGCRDALAVRHSLCSGRQHVDDFLAGVESQGGEGAVLRAPGSLYVAGRSGDVLKVKSYRDAEAVVVGHLPGKVGIGSLLVEYGGLRFAVGGLAADHRAVPPPVGSRVTFRYQGLTEAGVPRCASFGRVAV
ncbi:MAG: DNA ligase [Pirellulaceae bacterium]